MTTKLFNQNVNPKFEDLYSFDDLNDKIDHRSRLISYRILSEVEKTCEEMKIKKKDLADMVGTSKSYITQLFSGAKQVNVNIMAKFEEVLNIDFQIKIRLKDESHADFLGKQLTKDILGKKRFQGKIYTWYCLENRPTNSTSEMLQNLKTNNRHKQVG